MGCARAAARVAPVLVGLGRRRGSANREGPGPARIHAREGGLGAAGRQGSAAPPPPRFCALRSVCRDTPAKGPVSYGRLWGCRARWPSSRPLPVDQALPASKLAPGSHSGPLPMDPLRRPCAAALDCSIVKTSGVFIPMGVAVCLVHR
jgi:hypothetical protein